MRRLALTALILILAAGTVQAAELDLAAAAISGMEAGFTHHFTAKGFKTSQVERGSVVFGSLPMMRWSYTSPEKKEFVFDGTTSWFYVPGDRQVTISRITDARKRELPFLLLGDRAAREKHFSIKESRRGKSVVTTLTPRDRAALVRTVTVTTSAASHLIERIDYADRDGNRTSFDFSGYHRRPVSADTFRFSPPPGVQVVRAD